MRAIWNVLKSRARRRRGAIIRADNAMSASIYLHNADVGKTFLYIFFYYTINCRYNEQNINTRRSFYESEVVRKRRQLAFLFVTLDRKSTRLNSSHVAISYAVFCLKKKTK